ncbi:putative phosphohydrolase, MPP superfamily [Cyclonatronum proteinivorum]|uniref:Putative phosphohydrolase, MPP superfamily n=1 Tax=Cyclonatronum proteinivorum TaxID=1457365 RepID=A0A345UG10_9BACT|nr:metallophosphoesterase [Cyclonatronum proteinivorum]AXI99411.1 putative phosphohydrolase, MPP superfamily [Cyclonatronum proteinivorum]
MDNFVIFFVFYTMMLVVFGGMQYVVFQLYKRWFTYSFETERAQKTCLRIGYGVLFVGNLLFWPRFVIAYTYLHDSAFLQKFMVYPGGLYFAIIFLLFVFSTLIYAGRGIQHVMNYFKFAFGKTKPGNSSEQAQMAAGQSPELQPEPVPVPVSENVTSPEPTGISRRSFIRTAGAAAFGAPLLLTTGLSAATHRNYVISKNTLYFPNLPTGLEGLRLVHISDIHSGIFMNKRQIQEIYEIINSLNPNLVAITGDLVDTHITEIPNIRDTISMLKTDYGVFGCPGNHDHYASADALMDALADKPVSMLQNAHRELRINGEKLTMIGIDDAGEVGRDFADIEKAVRGSDPESFRILLSHRPHMFDDARAKDISLTLAGHTHGGQIGFNIAGLELYPIDWFHPYSRGHYTKEDRHLYVNVGVGLVGAPIRLVRPEITELTFTSNPALAGSVVMNA